MSLFCSPTPVALRRDAARLTSSSKKMRLSASLLRLGMNLELASPAPLGVQYAVSLYHIVTRRSKYPVAFQTAVRGAHKANVEVRRRVLASVAIFAPTTNLCLIGLRFRFRSRVC